MSALVNHASGANIKSHSRIFTATVAKEEIYGTVYEYDGNDLCRECLLDAVPKNETADELEERMARRQCQNT